MRELFLVRHAKSDWGTEALKDIDRHLNERGYSDAYFMSKWFLKNKKTPELILSSTATRALSTAMIFARTLEFNMNKFVMNEKLYESSVANFTGILQKQDASVKSIMVFCHNPCITEFCNKMCEDLFIDNVSTCGIVNLNFEVNNWKDISNVKATRGFFQFTKDFKNNID